MARVLCITNGTMALGETYVIRQFAEQLAELGHTIDFLSPRFGERFLRSSGFDCAIFSADREENTRTIEAAMAKKPDVVLLADYYFFQISKYLRELVDLQPVFASKVPIGVFDNASFYATTRTGRFRNTVARFSSSLTVPRLPSRTNFLLKPCAPHNPATAEKNVYRFRMRESIEVRTDERVREIKKSVHCPDGARMILWPVPSYLFELRWSPRLHRIGFSDDGLSTTVAAEGSPKRKPENNWYYHLNRLIVSYLETLDVPIHILNMSHYSEEYAAPQSDRITCHNMKPVDFHVFDDLLYASDVFMVDNRFSTTIGRALHFPTEVGCIINTLDILRKSNSVEPSFPLEPRAHAAVIDMEKHHPRAIKPSFFSHIGWVEALRNLLKDNPFNDTYELIDIFKESESIQALANLLVDEEAMKTRRQAKADYIASTKSLPSVDDIFQEVLGAGVPR